MTFNVWYGGVQVDVPAIGRAIRAADADIVGVQEPEGRLRRIARSAGLPYVDETLHVISRYPLFAANAGGVRIAYAAMDLDHVVAIANVHLTATPYGPEADSRRAAPPRRCSSSSARRACPRSSPTCARWRRWRAAACRSS